MAYVPEYKHDLFISYAHVDDDPMGAARDGWVTTMFRELRSKLSQKLGRSDAFAPWKDDGLSLHEGVTLQIMDAIGKTALLVVILSPGYLKSTWCLREKDTFLRYLRERRRSGTRVFVVELDDLEREKRPEELRELKGYAFWSREKPEDPPRPLCEAGLNSNDPDYTEYFRRLNKLATDLAKELEDLKRGTSELQQATPLTPSVFVAEATDDVDRIRDGVIDYLDQLKVPVFPERPYARDAAAFRDVMTGDLAECKLFVQILSGVRGKKVPDGPFGYPRLQYDIARNSGKDVLQWRDQGLDVSSVEDEDHRQLLREVTVRAEGIEDFKREIKRRLLEEPKPDKRKSGPQDLRALVFVDSDPDDWDLATVIRDRLREFGVDVSLPVWDQAPEAVREDLELNLTQCHALIVVYGKSTLNWVRRQLLGLYRKAVAQREQPLQALAVYQGPPEDKAPLNIEMHNLRVIDCTHTPADQTKDQLREFITHVQVR